MYPGQCRTFYKGRFDDQVLGMTSEGRALYICMAAMGKFAPCIRMMGDEIMDEYFGCSAEGEEHQQQAGQ